MQEISVGKYYRHFKGIIVDSLSAVLTDKNKELPVVKKGVDAFMWASDEERKEFCKVVQAVSYRVSAKITNLSDHGKKRIRIHDRKVKAIIVFVPSAEKFIRTRE